jgi:Flp pilus assembly protein TadD
MDIDAKHWEEVEEIAELLNEERFHEALVALRELITASPANPYAYHYLGVALFEVGEIAPARSAYLACLKVAPKHLGARVALAHVERTLGNTRDAVREGMTAAARRYLEAFLDARPEFEAATEVRAILASLEAPMPN